MPSGCAEAFDGHKPVPEHSSPLFRISYRPEMDAVVQLDGVTVIYGKNQALKNVTARFSKGAVGLLGPNGAGKSTMLKALLGFVKPDQGRMSVLDMDVAHSPLAIRARIGYMPESDAHIP